MLGIECIQIGRPHKQYAGCTTCNLMNMEAERDRLKAELEIVRGVSGNRLDLWMKKSKDYDHLCSLAQGMREAFYVFHTTGRGIVKIGEACAAWDAFEKGIDK